MPDFLIECLESFGYPVYLKNVFLDSDTYPDSFFIFWNTETVNSMVYDNVPKYIKYNYEITFYSVDPVLVNQMAENLTSKLLASGFDCTGEGYDQYATVQEHTGRTIKTEILWRNN